MDAGKKTCSIKELKEIGMVGFLSSLGYVPTKINAPDYWYLSPLRDEHTASFKVNTRLNCWYDHGLGKGGNLIDFGILYYNCTVGELLQKLATGFSFHPPILREPKQQAMEIAEPKINILQDFIISSFSLIQYLEQRKIPMEIAWQYCREVRYGLNDKIYYGIGFKNDAGGYEIRNGYFKASSSPKDIATFDNGAKEVLVFEGFTDFLSFVAMNQNQPKAVIDFLILNSVSFFEKARPFMEQHQAIRLYLDRDTAGQNCSRYALSLSKKYKDESNLYNGCKDLNEWWANLGSNSAKPLKQKL